MATLVIQDVAEQYLPIIDVWFSGSYQKTWLIMSSWAACFATSTYEPTATSSPSASTGGPDPMVNVLQISLLGAIREKLPIYAAEVCIALRC